MELLGELRHVLGKKTKSLRETGVIPAELYGHGTENLHLGVKRSAFLKVLREAGESSIVNLAVEGKKYPVMIHDVVRDPVSDEIIAIDFYKVRMDERIKVKVQLHFVGEAPAVKDKGGVLMKAVHELEVEALPAKLPHAIEVDLKTIADIGASIRAKDLSLGEGVKVLVNPETVIATVTERRAEVEEVKPEISVDDVKVETEEKKAEREKKKEGAEAGAAGA
jgi:large subunit ribosomal protein L25